MRWWSMPRAGWMRLRRRNFVGWVSGEAALPTALLPAGRFQAREKNRCKKIQAIYRASKAPNTGKVIEIAKEKARANNRSGNRKKQDAEPMETGGNPVEC